MGESYHNTLFKKHYIFTTSKILSLTAGNLVGMKIEMRSFLTFPLLSIQIYLKGFSKVTNLLPHKMKIAIFSCMLHRKETEAKGEKEEESNELPIEISGSQNLSFRG